MELNGLGFFPSSWKQNLNNTFPIMSFLMEECWSTSIRWGWSTIYVCTSSLMIKLNYIFCCSSFKTRNVSVLTRTRKSPSASCSLLQLFFMIIMNQVRSQIHFRQFFGSLNAHLRFMDCACFSCRYTVHRVLLCPQTKQDDLQTVFRGCVPVCRK